MFCSLFIVFSLLYTTWAQLWSSAKPDFQTHRINMITDIITPNMKKNGWSTILCFGNFPDELYNNLSNLSYPFAITSLDSEDEYPEDIVQYYSNTIIVNIENLEEYEVAIFKLISNPYWHPLSNILIYYHEKEYDTLAKIYFSLWYYKAINTIIVQYDDSKEMLLISHYSPYISDEYKLDHIYGCWTTRKIGMPVLGFDEGFTCADTCHNVSITSKLRAHNLGTCIGFSIIQVPYSTPEIIPTLNLFEDKSQNLHGFKFRVYTTEVKPFLLITDHGNGSYTLECRDGTIWNSVSKLMNFRLDLTPSLPAMKKPFNFEVNIQQLFSFAFRKADFYLGPIYLFDVAVVELDYVYPYKEIGVCIMSHRAGYVTSLFDSKSLHANLNTIIKFVLCFLGIWVTFAIYQVAEKRRYTLDQNGRDLLNAFRNVLLITLCNPPKRRSFRIFLTVSIWSFFVMNFAMQATIISFLTAAKRGKDIETFEDMIEKNYLIYGMASPDLILPDTEERFRIINSRLVPIQNLFECVQALSFDKHRLCLVDCAVGRYLERNQLNKEGEQYLHIAQDRMHSHYLTLLLTKHSPLTERFAKYLLTFYEAGLIKKWEQYRYTEIKEDPSTKPLQMDDFKSLFDVYAASLGILFILFLMELLIFHGKRICNC